VRLPPLVALTVLSLAASGCGYRSLVQQDEGVRAAWSELAGELQRRTDLVPNLMSAVQELTAHEAPAVRAVNEAQARALSMQHTPGLSGDAAALARLEAAEADLSRALEALLVIAGRYREIESDPAFREFSSELATTQERLARALAEYVDRVQRYNGAVQSFPSSLTARLLDLSVRPNLPSAAAAPVIPPVAPGSPAPSAPYAAARPAAAAPSGI